MERHTAPPSKGKRPEPIKNPGKGERTPSLWGRWLTSAQGLQRQMLGFFRLRDISRPGTMYAGLPEDENARARKLNAIHKRRARNKVARRSRRLNRIAAKR